MSMQGVIHPLRIVVIPAAQPSVSLRESSYFRQWADEPGAFMSAMPFGFARTSTKKSVHALLVIILLGALAACGAHPTISWKPIPVLPVAIVYSPPDHWSLEGDHSYATAFGEFSIGASYDLPQNNSDSMYVILRNRHSGFDHIYRIETGNEQFSAVLNGTTIVTVTHDQVLIDVTSGNIQKITFKQATSHINETSENSDWFSSTWHSMGSKWDTGWSQSWYKPFALSKWAYDDSTIEKWFGVGFILFLLRLILAVVLGLVDLILTMGFLVGQLAFLVFGPTGRDVVYGFMVIGVIVIVGAGIAGSA
jgi:hypothetical protein